MNKAEIQAEINKTNNLISDLKNQKMDMTNLKPKIQEAIKYLESAKKKFSGICTVLRENYQTSGSKLIISKYEKEGSNIQNIIDELKRWDCDDYINLCTSQISENESKLQTLNAQLEE